jgi:hypothetical protein
MPFKLGQSIVCRIGCRSPRFHPSVVVEGAYCIWIALKRIRSADILNAMFAPETIISFEYRKPTLGRYAGPCKNEDVHDRMM